MWTGSARRRPPEPSTTRWSRSRRRTPRCAWSSPARGGPLPLEDEPPGVVAVDAAQHVLGQPDAVDLPAALPGHLVGVVIEGLVAGLGEGGGEGGEPRGP